MKCTHEWYQKRDDLISSEESYDVDEDSNNQSFDEIEDITDTADSVSDKIDAELEEEDIPDGVKPIQEAVNVPALTKGLRPKVKFQEQLTGYLLSLVIFGILITAGFLFKQQIVKLWSPSAIIYELAGSPVILKGEELVIESLTAKIEKDVDGQNYLLLQGRVINLTNKTQAVPSLMARLRSTNGDEGDKWNIDTPLEKLEPGESFTFKSDYPAVPRGVGSVNLTFVPTVSL